MRSLFGSLLALGLLATSPTGADRLDQLFAAWEQEQRGIQSLVVEFTLTTKEPIFNDTQKAAGVFRLLRTPTGELFASYDLHYEKLKGEKSERFSGLLYNGAVYLLIHEKKAALRFKAAEDDLPDFLERYFNPFVLLLDRKRAEERCKLEIVQQDEWYTYLNVRPLQGKGPSWFNQGQVVLVNKDAKILAKNMPRRLWFANGNRIERTFEITGWRINAVDGPKAEDFQRPEDLPGWETAVWRWPL